MQVKIEDMEKQIAEKNESEQNEDMANEQISDLQDQLEQKNLELSGATDRLKALEDSTKENEILDELKDKHLLELESFKDQISNLHCTLELKSQELSDATVRLKAFEESKLNDENLDDLKDNHAQELESYKDQISMLQDTLKQKCLELSDVVLRLEALEESTKGELMEQ